MNHIFNISAILLSAIERYQYYRARDGFAARVAQRYFILKHLIFTIITGSDISPFAKIGKRLFLPHPNGVIIHKDAVIGDDCIIMQQVTVGQLAVGNVPKLGNGVYIGAGAKVLGPISIGDRARIGANSVVLSDIPAGKTAVGIPAKVVNS
ncbi:serine O-acetyltransferase [Bradyrhizobium sp. GCM10023182]|uniref:Serine acetyltransferase n=1 Tax=Bradyrhizobium zhengyangense TaxID=2911009 RepID=A0ABS9M1R3_9BRAD|nr:DapH/DapD/GlmU-related protein [Bradyrhizobium zhengyangense]MCG2673202.1 serine acetyltransferase [Bradyrhizobium zhengyangense]